MPHRISHLKETHMSDHPPRRPWTPDDVIAVVVASTLPLLIIGLFVAIIVG